MVSPTQRTAMALKARRRSQANLTLISGPPCAGKTTYARDNAGPNDVILDYDLIAQELGSTTTHGHAALHDATVMELNRRLDASRTAPHVWLVKCEPTRTDLARAAQHVRLDPGIDVCMERAELERPATWPALITAWYRSNT